MLCLNNIVEQEGVFPWPGFPLECRSHHRWLPGGVTITWEPCDCPASRVEEDLEGCLSVPGVTAVRARAARAVAAGVDVRQDPVTVAGVGELARCLQHETDHLRGELFIDKLEAEERRRVMRQVRGQWPLAVHD